MEEPGVRVQSFLNSQQPVSRTTGVDAFDAVAKELLLKAISSELSSGHAELG